MAALDDTSLSDALVELSGELLLRDGETAAATVATFVCSTTPADNLSHNELSFETMVTSAISTDGESSAVAACFRRRASQLVALLHSLLHHVRIGA